METLLLDALDRAFDNALDTVENEQGKINEARSIEWIQQLGSAFAKKYAADPKIRVFWKQSDSNRRAFGLNELLHDVVVVECEETISPRHKARIPYVKSALWQVESELELNGRSAVMDFNKLVLGSAQNKLFVGPITSDPGSFRESLAPIAQACSGNVYAAFIPAPNQWYKRSPEVSVWKYRDSNWKPYECELI